MKNERNKKKVLIIDDDPDVLHMLKNMFKALGCSTLAAGNGASGIHLALNEKPQLVIVDVSMPGQSGITVLSTIRKNEQLRKTPIFIFSGINDSIFSEEALRQGATDFFGKPADLSKLISRSCALLGI